MYSKDYNNYCVQPVNNILVVSTQILSNLAISMQYQIRYEYNATALPSNRTAAETLKLTTAWDTLQIKAGLCGDRTISNISCACSSPFSTASHKNIKCQTGCGILKTSVNECFVRCVPFNCNSLA